MPKNIPQVGQFERLMPSDRTGLAVRQNPDNGFVVVELDFIANPVKRDPEWIRQEKLGMPPDRWEVEMLRSWKVFKGKPVYKDIFYKHLHVSPVYMPINPNYPVLRGWDFGGNQSCAIGQFINGRLVGIDELPNGGTNTREFGPKVIGFCNSTYGEGLTYIDIVDPSAQWEGKTSMGYSCVKVLRDLGLTPKPASTNDPEIRVQAVTDLLMCPWGDQRSFILNSHLNMTIKGFEGGYHYPEKPSQNQRADRPVKNLYSHIHDAWQYLALRVRRYADRKDRNEEIQYERALTKYSFQC